MQDKAMDLLLGNSLMDVAEMLEIPVKKLRVWLRDPNFKQELTRRGAEEHESAGRIARRSLLLMAEYLRNQAGEASLDPKLCWQALTEAELHTGGTGDELADIVARISAQCGEEDEPEPPKPTKMNVFRNRSPRPEGGFPGDDRC